MEKYPTREERPDSGRDGGTASPCRQDRGGPGQAARQAVAARPQRRRGPAHAGRPAGRHGQDRRGPGDPPQGHQERARQRPVPVWCWAAFWPSSAGTKRPSRSSRSCSSDSPATTRSSSSLTPTCRSSTSTRVITPRARPSSRSCLPEDSRRSRRQQRPGLPLRRAGQEPREGRVDDPQGRAGRTRTGRHTSTAWAGSCSSGARPRRPWSRCRRPSSFRSSKRRRAAASRRDDPRASGRRLLHLQEVERARKIWQRPSRSPPRPFPPTSGCPRSARSSPSLKSLGPLPKSSIEPDRPDVAEECAVSLKAVNRRPFSRRN